MYHRRCPLPCNALYVIASGKPGTPRDTFVPVGKRNKQAKDKQLTFTAIVWSKVKFMTRTALCSLPYEVLFYVIARHCPLWGPQKILCTFGEKAQTRKRVSVIAPDNVISKAQFAPHRPEGTPHKTPARYFCTRGERRVHKIRICRSIALFNDSAPRQIRGPQKILCTFGEKEHTSKRVSIIACNNVISKAQCATGSDTKH